MHEGVFGFLQEPTLFAIDEATFGIGSPDNVTITMTMSRIFPGLASKGRDNSFEDSFNLGKTAKGVLERAPLFLSVVHETGSTLTLQS